MMAGEIVGLGCAAALVGLGIFGLDWVMRQAVLAEEEARAFGDVIELPVEARTNQRGNWKGLPAATPETGGRVSVSTATGVARGMSLTHSDGVTNR